MASHNDASEHQYREGHHGDLEKGERARGQFQSVHRFLNWMANPNQGRSILSLKTISMTLDPSCREEPCAAAATGPSEANGPPKLSISLGAASGVPNGTSLPFHDRARASRFPARLRARRVIWSIVVCVAPIWCWVCLIDVGRGSRLERDDLLLLVGVAA